MKNKRIQKVATLNLIDNVLGNPILDLISLSISLYRSSRTKRPHLLSTNDVGLLDGFSDGI